MIRQAALLALALFARPVFAQAPSCHIPEHVTAPPIAAPDGPARNLPITHYVLALTWAPDFCATHGGTADAMPECDLHGARFGFVLHGLWPDAAHGTWPQWCPAKAPATLQVPADVTRGMLCTTPSPALIAHEWAKHGTCMAPRPEVYFTQSAAMFHALHLPDMAALSRRAHLTAGDLRSAFAEANPLYPRAAIGVATGEGGSLQEVHVCFDRRLRPAACTERGMADTAPLRIVPQGR
ncbi:ribonuclease T2 family protein [Novosphingobium sp.]|uniref:ribonuclease T2 family protein n=1 Tax=Novosphingobium sp. TaxID=1874826 RepID=UPI003D11A7D3